MSYIVGKWIEIEQSCTVIGMQLASDGCLLGKYIFLDNQNQILRFGVV